MSRPYIPKDLKGRIKYLESRGYSYVDRLKDSTFKRDISIDIYSTLKLYSRMNAKKNKAERAGTYSEWVESFIITHIGDQDYIKHSGSSIPIETLVYVKGQILVNRKRFKREKVKPKGNTVRTSSVTQQYHGLPF